MSQPNRSQILVDSKSAKFLLKVRRARSRFPQLEEAIITKLSGLEGTLPSRHIHVKKT